MLVPHALPFDWSQLHPKATSAVTEWLDSAWLQIVNELAPPTMQTFWYKCLMRWRKGGSYFNNTSYFSDLLITPILRLPSTREQLFGFNVPGHCLVRACLLYCMRVQLCNGYTQAYAQIMQHTHTHKAVTRRVEAKKLLSCRRQSNYRVIYEPHPPIYRYIHTYVCIKYCPGSVV